MYKQCTKMKQKNAFFNLHLSYFIKDKKQISVKKKKKTKNPLDRDYRKKNFSEALNFYCAEVLIS